MSPTVTSRSSLRRCWRLKQKEKPIPLDDCKVVNEIFFVLRTGAQWCHLSERYGPDGTVYNRFERCAKKGAQLRICGASAPGSQQSL